MTEEEAKTKWCPHAIASHTNPRQHNGEVWLHNCIGSACMAWRSLDVYDNRERHLWSRSKGERVTAAIGDDAEWRLANPNEPPPAPRGFCGLAGKP